MHTRVFPPIFSRPYRVLSLSRICCYSLIVFLNFVFSLSWKWSQTCTLFMLELKQPYYDHLVIQSEKLLFFLTRKVSWVNKWSKRECFEDKPRSGRPSVDQYCSKINRESEVQTEQFNKEDCQEFSPENYWSFEHNGGDTWPGKDGGHSSERKYLCWAKSKVKPAWDSPLKKHA